MTLSHVPRAGCRISCAAIECIGEGLMHVGRVVPLDEVALVAVTLGSRAPVV